MSRSAPRSSPRPFAVACLATLALFGSVGCRPGAPSPAPARAPTAADARKPAEAKPAARTSDAARKTVVATPRPAPATPPRFVDVAHESGIDFTYFNDEAAENWLIVEVMGGGAAWLDVDLDGWLDLYLTEGCRLEKSAGGDGEHRDRLYRGRGAAGFRDISGVAGIGDDHYGQGVAVGDYDADGFPDLYLANFGPAVLLRNNGDGTFTDVTAPAGIDFAKWGTSAAFADLDHDGQLDIYACTFLDNRLGNNKACDYPQGRGYCGPGSYVGEQDQVWVSRGDGTFTERSAELGFIETSGRGKGLAVSIVDLDDDLLPEVYVGNDMTPNYLYTPRPAAGTPIRYDELATSAGCAVSDDGENEASMGIVTEDFDGDGRPDIFLAHFYQAKNTLYQNVGQLLFADISRKTRIAATSLHNLGFGAVGLDWDRDGRMEMFVATGHVLGPRVQPYQMQPQLLWQAANGTFVDVSDDVGGEYFGGKWLGRAAAGADYDNDGDLDLAVSHNISPVALLRDDTAAPGRFLGLDLRTPSRIPPVGGRVEVTCDGRTTVRPIAAGGSYLSSHDPRILITLPPGDSPADVTIHWPSGRVESLPLEADAYWQVLEGEAPRRVNPPQASPGRGQSAVGMR